MLRTLRSQLILSHVLPLLIVVPLMGMALMYVLESQVVLSSLSRELTEQGRLVAKLVQDQPGIWDNPTQARAFVDNIGTAVRARLMLLTPSETLLASSDPSDADRLGQQIQIDGWATALAGQSAVHTVYSQRLRDEIVDVLIPVMDPGGQIVGVVRLSHPLTTIYQQFLQLRYLISGILLGGLVLGTAAGWFLALNLGRPLQEATDAVCQLASGERLTPLPERGPEEIDELLRSVNTLVERLNSLEQARRQLLSNLVHELGRPLGALRAAVQTLMGRSGEDAVLRRELLTGMDDEILRLRRLLDDLAGLHDQALGTLKLNPQPIHLSEWLSRLVTPWRESAQAKGLEWRTTIPPDLPTLEIDPDRLAQAVGNLLSNAIKYTPTRGTVSVSAGTKGQEAWIRVSDTGRGIPLEEQESVFTPFYRSRTASRFQQGMGLGLSIARSLIAAHHGRLELDSTPGLGSNFTIWLPFLPSALSKPSHQA
jgi:two-component system sensor histidine kinase BaeS